MKRVRHIYILGLILGFVLLNTSNIKASHIMGGDLTFTCSGTNTYNLQLRLFQDCNGNQILGPTTSVTFSSPTCGTFTETLNLLPGYPIDITPLCPTQQSSCDGGNGILGVKEFVYKAAITLPCSGDYTVSWATCCRNGAINTLQNPSGAGFSISSNLNTAITPCNNSPDFLNSPVAYFCVNQPLNYNHGPTDFDNDSLVFSLIPCQGTNINYQFPYSGVNPVATTGGITIDPATGGLSFTPTMVQTAVLCVLVEEYRNGVKIGEIMRDMQFEILNCPNTLPVASGINGTADSSGTSGVFTMTVCADDTVDFLVKGFDINISHVFDAMSGWNTMTMDWNQAIQGAQFTSDGATYPTGRFFWVPDNGDIGNNIFTVDVRDDACMINGINIYSFLIVVEERPEMDAGNYQITCNPGDSVTLNGTFNSVTNQSGVFTWSPPQFLSDTLGQTIMAGPDSTMTYTANVTYSNGCSYTDEVIVEVSDSLTLPSMTDTVICRGSSVQLDATIPASGGIMSFMNDTVKAIPDNDPIGVYSYMNVSGVSPAAMSATTINQVCINVTQQFFSNDLDIFLISPNGTMMELSTDNGGSNPNAYTNTCFSPTATTSIIGAPAPMTGTYAPEGNFSVFTNNSTNGVWALWVVDDGSFSTGSIIDWSIEFANPNTYTYAWSPTDSLSCTTCSDPIASPSATTTYAVTATNQNGCFVTDSITIEVIDTLLAPNIFCAGVTPFSLTFAWDTVVGAVGYEVNIDNGGWITPSGPGQTHSVTGLTVNQTVNIQVRGISTCPGGSFIGTHDCTTGLCANGSLVSSTNISCNGGTDGSLTVGATGGTMPYQYAIDGGTFQVSPTFNNLAAGNHFIVILDAASCLDTVFTTLTEPLGMTTTMSTDSVSCFNGNDGTATVAVLGGTSGYTYAWSNLGTTPTITGLTIGTYTVTVTDANNCQTTNSVVVEEPVAITATSVATDVSCNGANDGSVTVTAAGGNGGYTYSWTGSASSTNIASNLSGGFYTATINDNKNCTVSITDTVLENTAIVLTETSVQALCNTSTDGMAIVSATGGAGNYTYLWDANAANQVTDTAFSLGSGTYMVTVTDADNCSQTITSIVGSSAALSVSSTSTPTSCFNTTDGTGTITISGGTPAYSYSWVNSTDTLATGTGLGGGFQTFTVTDGNGCTITDSVNVQSPTPITTTLTPTAASCFGIADGSVSVTAIGGAGGYTYAWSNSSTTPTITGLLAGTYYVTVTDANNCQTVDSSIVLEPAELTVTSVATNVSCNGANDGSVTVTPVGGNGGYTYSWTGSASSSNIASSLSGGFYTATINDSKNCTVSITDTVLENTAIVLGETSIMTLCNTSADGMAIVTATGGTGTGTYTYLWDVNAASQVTDTAFNVAAGTYTVTVTDADNCSQTITSTVTSPTALSVSATSTPTSCFNTTDGTGTIVVTGGTTPYSYSWVNSTDTLATGTGLGNGFQTFTVTDANGCTITDSVNVQSPTQINITLTPTAVSCFGAPDGAISATVTGGAGGYTYAWSGTTATTATVNNLAGGFHTVTVTDQNGCFETDTVTIFEPISLTIALTKTDVSCFNGSDGSASVTVNGGTNPYLYSWTPSGQSTPTANNIQAGWHTVVVTDANNCQAVDSIFVNQPATGVTTVMSTTPLLCNGDATGTASVLATGGSGTYTYSWSHNTALNSPNATGLQAGNYTVTVSDVNNCDYVDNVDVIEPTALATVMSMTATSCNGYSDGTAMVVASGGVGNYSYAWLPNGGTDSLAINLSAGLYGVSVTDGNGCMIGDTITVDEPNGMTLTMSMTPVSCHSGSDGTASVSVIGGTGNYSYAWSDSPMTASTAINLSAGWHVVTVTDANGCFKADSIEITEPDTLTVTLSAVDVSCFGGSDGSTNVVPVGGVGNYTYAWSPSGQTTQTASNLQTGTHIVTVTDGNSCIATGSVFVNQPPTPVSTTTSMTEVLCNGGNTGTATVVAVGGAGNYSYLWSNSDTNATAINLTAGAYSVTVTDQNGCFTVDNITVDEPSPILLIVGQTATSCFGGNDGTATAVGSGGVPNASGSYLFSWNTSPVQFNTATATGLNGGQTYTVTAQDENGCIATQEITINQPTPIQLTTTQNNVSCHGFTDASSIVTPSGGTPGFSYVWTNGDSTALADSLAFGIYTVTVTDFNNCSEETQVTITEPAPLSITSTVEDVVCKGDSSGSATLLAAGGTPWYSFTWSNGRTTNMEENLPAGFHNILMTDANGCKEAHTILISEPAVALSSSFTPSPVSCFGDRDGEIFVNAAGGLFPYQYSIDGQNFSNSNIIVGLTGGEYLVHVRDDVGCVYTDTVAIAEPDELIVDAGADLYGDFGVGIPILPTVTGGQFPLFYSWTPNDSTLSCITCPVPIAFPNEDQFYTVTVTDANGCIASDEVGVRISKDRQVYVATGFTPNNDGVNDVLFIQGGEYSDVVVSFRVYDRWGETVFVASDTPLNDINFGWNGMFKGEVMNSGVYGWVAEIEFSDGERIQFKGNTTLIR